MFEDKIMKNKNIPDQSELPDCLVLNTVAASRALLRHYDSEIKEYGVTVQQFALLSAISLNPESNIATLAERVYLDRTSLTRNLDLLEKKALIKRTNHKKSNAKISELTKEGVILLEKLVPIWKDAQKELRSKISADEAATFLKVLKTFSK